MADRESPLGNVLFGSKVDDESGNSRRSVFSPYTREELDGVRKYQWRRFIFGCGSMLIIALTALIVGLCVMASRACTRYELAGTWVLESDYRDGYDSVDCYVEFRTEENDRGEKVFVAYKNGECLGEVDGSRAIERKHYTFFSNYGHDATIQISFEREKMVFRYKDYVEEEILNNNIGFVPVLPPEISPADIYDGFLISPSVLKAVDVTETYIRISADSRLTEEQRADLY